MPIRSSARRRYPTRAGRAPCPPRRSARTSGIDTRRRQRRPSASCMSGTSHAACSCKLLLVDDVLLLDAHADALVEVGRTRRVLGINAERHAAEAAIVE